MGEYTLAASGVAHRLGIPYTVRPHGLRFRIEPRLVDPIHAWRIKHGKHERQEFEAAQVVFHPDLPVVEGGAGYGVTSCRLNRLLSDPTQHLVVEPNPSSRRYVMEQARLNGSGFRVLLGAIGYYDHPLRIQDPGRVIGGFSIGEMKVGAVEVPWFRLRDLVTGPCNVALDIEGMELQVVSHDLEVLRRHVVGLTIDWTPHVTTGIAVGHALQRLSDAGFELQYMANNVTGHRNTNAEVQP